MLPSDEMQMRLPDEATWPGSALSRHTSGDTSICPRFTVPTCPAMCLLFPSLRRLACVHLCSFWCFKPFSDCYNTFFKIYDHALFFKETSMKCQKLFKTRAKNPTHVSICMKNLHIGRQEQVQPISAGLKKVEIWKVLVVKACWKLLQPLCFLSLMFWEPEGSSSSFCDTWAWLNPGLRLAWAWLWISSLTYFFMIIIIKHHISVISAPAE